MLMLTCLTMANCRGKSLDSTGSTVAYNRMAENFKTPDADYGVNCWWWWLNGNVNKAAITKDLEAMKSRNFHGAMIFDAGGHNQRGNKDIPQGPLYGSDEWNELFVFALDEARRLGLQMGFNIQSGWNLGGPRVTPQYAAKQITYSEIIVSGNKKVTLKLDVPKIRKNFYRDIAVLAFPISNENKTSELISDLELKLGFHELGGSAPDCRFLLGNIPRDNRKSVHKMPDEKSTYIVNKEEVVNLSSSMDPEGKLSWDVPGGEWTIMRMGYTCTDAHVSTSSGDWQGSVLDYMSKEAFDFYWNDVVEPIFEATGDHMGTTLKYMETDSWECGGMNWTDSFPDAFNKYRGYDIFSYLPVVGGYVIDDIPTSNAFLADFRKTLGDLVAYKHYAVFQEYAHKYNMGIQPESAGPHAGPMDGIKNYGFSDIVMSEFWSPSPHRPRPENRVFLKQASSAAHIYGKQIVGAESFTTIGPHWNDELWHDQKSSFDHEICAGLNRMYFHTFTCSPPEMGLPGQEYFAGTHVNPQVTWWDQSGPFIDYMHRTQSVVQNGKFVADVLYYYGDHVPNVFPFKHSDPAGVMPGFDYDVTDETIFLQLEVKDGKILVPGGIEYRVLVLPDHRVLSMPVLQKIEELLQEGAQVIGYKPEKLISLSGGTDAQKQFSELADKIWGNDVSEKGEKNYGKGLVAWGMFAREYLLSKGLPADFNIVESDSKTDFDYIHYTIAGNDVYFVSNQTTEIQDINCQFRISGKQPELWDALSGEISVAEAFGQADGLTTIPLILDAYGAVMVVFNKKINKDKQGMAPHNSLDYRTVKVIDGEWEVYFDPQWGGPGSVTFPELLDWSKHPDEGIKHYSGIAVYNKTFDIDFEPQEGKQYFLQLDRVKDAGIAQVKINGEDKGILWTKPFRVEVSQDLNRGENTLEIKVVNSWYNRVAGDELFPDKPQYTSTNAVLMHDFRGRPRKTIPLEPSGLLGPVTISEGEIKGTSIWTKEYHVSPGGSDENDGSVSMPFRTISKAATIAQPGDTITVHEGLYRERVNPLRGGISDSKRILYRAAPGELVYISGSEVVRGWKTVMNDAWTVSVPNDFFGPFNPFNDIISGDWFRDEGRTHHTGCVYVNGHWIREAAKKEDVLRPAGKKALWFAVVGEKETTIWAQFLDGDDPNDQITEVNVRQTVFYPEKPGMDYITVRGFVMEHAATPWAPPTAEQIGLIGTHWAKGWIIEDNTIRYSRNVGVTLGKYGDEWDNRAESAFGYNQTIQRALENGWSKENIGHHIVRNNHILQCGQAGIVGSMGAAFSIITGNEIHAIYLDWTFSGAEMAGIKFHGAIDTEISNNHIYLCGHNGIWLDWMTQGTRVSGKLMHRNTKDLFVEVNHGPFLVDNNLFLSPYALLESYGGGAYVHDLFAGEIKLRAELTRETPFHLPHSTEMLGISKVIGDDERFFNNLFVGSTGLSVYGEDALNLQAGGNVFMDTAKPSVHEKDALVLEDINPNLKFVQMPNGWWLEFTIDADGFSAQKRDIVTTRTLGQAMISKAVYENPDGSPYRIESTYFRNKTRTGNPSPGPFQLQNTDSIRIKVWPK